MTSIKSYAYIEIIFDKKTKDYFKKIVKQLVPKDKLYYSSKMSHIKGDVTKSLHCTLFFGINPAFMKDKQLLTLVKNADFKEITLGNFVLFKGWHGHYEILCIEILNEQERFTKFAKEVEDFVNDEDIKYIVRPHISLAYVKPDYQIPKHSLRIKHKLNSKKVQISVFEN